MSIMEPEKVYSINQTIKEEEESKISHQYHDKEKSRNPIQSYPEHFTQETIQKFQKLVDFHNEPTDAWEQVTKKDDIYIYKTMKPGQGSVFIKGSALIPGVPKEVVFQATYQAEFRQSWDKIMSGFKSVLRETDDTDIIYYAVSPPVPVVATREWL